MKVMGKIRLLLSSVLCAGLLVSAIAVPQASASDYEETYSYSLSYNNLDYVRIYGGTSAGALTHLFGSTTTPDLTTVYFQGYSTTSYYSASVVYDGEGTYSASNLPPGTSSSYPYATTTYTYLDTSPVTTGTSEWTFYFPRAYDSTSYFYSPVYLVTYYNSTPSFIGRLNLGTMQFRFVLLNSSGTALNTSDWVSMSTSSGQTVSVTSTSPVYGVRIDISLTATYSNYPVTCWLGSTFFSAAYLHYTDTDYNSYYKDVVDGLDSIDDNITESTNSIIDNLLSLPSMIIDGILGLFVPSADDLSDIYDDFTDLMEEKLGAIWQVGSIISSFFEGLSTDEEANTITFPGISFPMNGELVTIASAQSVQIVPDEIYNADWYDLVRLAVTAVLVFAWVMGMEKMLERMLSPDGRSED